MNIMFLTLYKFKLALTNSLFVFGANRKPRSAEMRKIADLFDKLHRQGVRLGRHREYIKRYAEATGVWAFPLLWGQNLDFIGAERLARHVGFRTVYSVRLWPLSVEREDANYEFAEWAGCHPDIWGNMCGSEMFCDPSFAFGVEEFTLEVIARHFRNVADRLDAAKG